MIYLLITNGADLQEHKRNIAKRGQPFVLCIVLVFYIFSLQKISEESWVIREKIQGAGVADILFY